MKQSRFKRLVKVANTKGISSPEFRRALRELITGPSSSSPRRKRKARGDQTNGKRKRNKNKGSFPPKSKPSDYDV